MKRFPVIATLLLIGGLLATAAFQRPLHTFNGVVRDYSSGGGFSMVERGTTINFLGGSNLAFFPNGAQSGMGGGAGVTVWATCVGNGGNSNGNEDLSKTCRAVAVIVHSAATGGTIPATGGTGGATSGTATPSTGGTGGTGSTGSTGSTAATSTPAAGGTGTTATATSSTGSTAATATSMCVTPTVMVTGTPGTMATDTPAVGTMTPMVICTPMPTSTP